MKAKKQYKEIPTSHQIQFRRNSLNCNFIDNRSQTSDQINMLNKINNGNVPNYFMSNNSVPLVSQLTGVIQMVRTFIRKDQGGIAIMVVIADGFNTNHSVNSDDIQWPIQAGVFPVNVAQSGNRTPVPINYTCRVQVRIDGRLQWAYGYLNGTTYTLTHLAR